MTTVFVRQGHYALDAKALAKYPAAAVSLERIGDLMNDDFKTLRHGNAEVPPEAD